jgi:hypothetical protein
MTSSQSAPLGGTVGDKHGRFGWLVTDFTERVPGVAHAIVV